jgi:CHAT domain-containing protein
LRKLLSSPALPRFAAIALLLCGGGGVWWACAYQSNVDKGLAQLRAAYRGQRPTESRTTANFDYAPFSTTRSAAAADDAPFTGKDTARHNAELYILSASREEPTNPAAHHAVGLLYLAEKKFDAALHEFKLALELAPGNARYHSDAGAAYLEKAALAEGGKEDEFSENADAALRHLNRALELDENLLEALFNKALILQKIPISNQAAETWKKYLEKDSASRWAQEAADYIRELESKKSLNLDATQLEAAFLHAFQQKNEIEAWQLISQNKEIIKEKYLPQRLALSMTAAAANNEEKNKYLEALIYAGELEKKYIGDAFAADLADFYAKTSETNLELLKEAHDLTREGYSLCRNGHRVREALEKFILARQKFLQTGNVWEARLSEFLIAYCLKNSNRIIESLPLIEDVIDFCRPKNYKWLLSSILVWYAGAQRAAGQRAGAEISYRDSLNLAKEINDSFMIQSTLLELAKQRYFVGQNREALRHLYGVFKSGDTPGASLRQKWRNYSDGAELLAKVEHYELAKAAALENIRLAEDLKSPLFLFYSQLDVGIAYARAGDDEEAKKWLLLAKQNAASINNVEDQKEILTKTSLELGHLERKIRNYARAAELYYEATSHARTMATPQYIYEAGKNWLLAEVELGNDEKAEKQLPEILQMAESYREQISDERERISFFNNEQAVYDIAIALGFKLGKHEQAYNYLEKSSSRSLLYWLKKSVEDKGKKENLNSALKIYSAPENDGEKAETASGKNREEPLRLDEIRAQMPERVQILQYTVLEDKVLIWLVSKDNFAVPPPVEIAYEKLNEKVSEYAQKLSSPDSENQAAAKLLGRELYDLLIAPVAGQLDPEREICLIPHKILFKLNFAALTSPADEPFLRRFNFFYAPSANVFLLSTDNARRKSALSPADESLLSAGNPHFDRREFGDLPNLPDAEDEALQISRLYPRAQKLIGPEATKSALQNSMQNAEVIHFAGHYLVRRGEPLASGLLLTKNGDDPDSGILTNAELIRQPLPRVKLVVLPACQTGVEQYYNGEGLVGLSRTFLAAGAPLVVASHWQVDSLPTAKLMKKFHLYRKRDKLSTTAALRRAQLEMMEDPSERFRQPYFWAAFAAYGGYTEF